ncbi:DUF2946 domain-containing protein [Carnimonas bestiolae]|uniref:DUF2946 domain-containing protein n=1 Tax=Carnimonas bestiolae TaxID=3402172 RepID=UPI003F4A8626
MIKIGLNNVFQQRLAAVMALFAMLILFVGPVVSQLQNVERHSTVGQHHNAMAGCDMADMQPSHHDHENALSHWFDQCGYCSLWQHFPTAPFDLPVIIYGHLAPAITVRASPTSAAAETVTYSLPQSRGPPSIS